MSVLIAGLVIFLGIHSVQVFASGWRRETIARIDENRWKLAYTAIALVGFVMTIWGYGLARLDPVVLWSPPLWTKHIALLLNLVAFVLLAFYLVPSGRVKARLGHPMLLAVKTWAVAHLIANGTLADVLLFGSFLAWGVIDLIANKRRDRASGIVRTPGPARNDAIAAVLGVALWAAMIWRVHLWIVGVSPLA